MPRKQTKAVFVCVPAPPKRALRLCSDRMFCHLVSACMFPSKSKTGSWAWALVFLGGVAIIAEIVSIQMIGSNANQVFSAVGPARPPAAPAGTFEVLVATRDLSVGMVLLADEKLWITKAVPNDTAAGAVTKESDLTDRRLTRAVRAGEPFRLADLTPPAAAPVAPAPRPVEW